MIEDVECELEFGVGFGSVLFRLILVKIENNNMKHNTIWSLDLVSDDWVLGKKREEEKRPLV